MTAPELIDRLAGHTTVGSAPREELVWLASHGSLRRIAAGEVVSRKGVPVTGLFVVLSGKIAIYVDRGAVRHKLVEWGAGDVAGVLPYSRLTSPPGDSVALEPSEILSIPRDDLMELVRECHEITSILVHKMLDRSRAFTSSALQDERMISLGKLAAGLAHELNNPIAAIQRNAEMLASRLDDEERATRVLGSSHLTEAELAAIEAVRTSCVVMRRYGVLTPIQQAEREESIADWLEDHGADPALAGPLAETDVKMEDLDRVASEVRESALDAVLRSAAAGCALRVMAAEIQGAAHRVSNLVSAVKGFTHMDQAAAAEPVDLKPSLGNTVSVLNSKARAKSASVIVTVEPDLPRVRGFAGELSQIWANLIDNALDAVPDAGRVEITASHDRHRAVVRIVDNGHGIPPEIRARLFEPFVTTKPVGKGTGLGLDIVRRLVSHNDGAIEVESAPGKTEFRVSLPLADAPAPDVTT